MSFKIQHNVSLKHYNTFGMDVRARRFAEVRSLDDVEPMLQAFEGNCKDALIFGGGSNILFSKDVDQPVLHIALRGIYKIKESRETVDVRIGAGENWHGFVQYCLDHDWGGVENLSLIPGTAGAAPIQNIGAYGIELSEVFLSLEAIDLTSGDLRTFHRNDCGFEYRNSVFKQNPANPFLITSVTLHLTKPGYHRYHTDYGSISDKLNRMGIDNNKVSIQAISEAVIAIRRRKLPDPAVIGNAGSFFKNPVIPKTDYKQLKSHFPDLPHFPVDDNHVKVPAGWLIDQCGWKGHRRGAVGVHEFQALVLVNYGGGTGDQILGLAQHIQASVKDRFGILLEREVKVI